jgi:hypothetical protein
MTASNREKCADKDKSVCDYNEFRRLRYFHGMLLDDKDFSSEQEYHDHKRRFLNRMLHGSGVVCGLDLDGKRGGRWIEVTSGLALDCSGNEIWVPRTTRIDLASLLPPKVKGKNQPECEEPDGARPNTYHIGIRYEEKPTNPVSVYLPSGGCEERACENSRYKEGFCVEVVQCCPEKPDPRKYPGLIKGLCECNDNFEKPEEAKMPLCPKCHGKEGKKLCECIRMEEFCEQSVPCPECGSCDKPCHVVLGQIEVDEEGRLVSLCINECRRYVLTGRMLQHMLAGVFAGGEKYFQMNVNGTKTPLPDDAGEWPYNPIKALCWWLPFKLAGGEFIRLDCYEQEVKDRPELETRFNAMEQSVQALTESNSQLRETVNRFGEQARDQQMQLAKMVERPATENQAASETPATPEKPSATEETAAAEKPATTKSPKTPPK